MKMTVRSIDFAKHGAPSKSNCIGLKFVLLNFHSKMKQTIRIKRSGIIICCCCCNAEVYLQQKKRKYKNGAHPLLCDMSNILTSLPSINFICLLMFLHWFSICFIAWLNFKCDFRLRLFFFAVVVSFSVHPT